MPIVLSINLLTLYPVFQYLILQHDDTQAGQV